MPRTWLVATVAATVLTLLTACSGEAPTPPPSTTPTTTPSTESSTAPPGLAPPVLNPLDVDEFADNPCASLTATQLRDLGLNAGKREEPENAGQEYDNCTYPASDSASELVVIVNYFPDSIGLNYRYEEHEDGRWPQWRPTEVDSYPAVIFSSKDPTPSPQECDLDVGVSDSSFVYVRAAYFAQVNHGWQETCAMTKEVAAAVLATLKATN